MENNSLNLRVATPEDYGFLFQLQRSTMKDYVQQTWGWDETWQQEYFQQHFNPASCQIINSRGEDIGVLSVESGSEEILLHNIQLIPEYQGKGIGTSLINSILEEARQSGRQVALQVLKVNPARRLYERLGFIEIGQTETHYLMKALPSTSA